MSKTIIRQILSAVAIISATMFVSACGDSAEEMAERNAAEQRRLAQEDSLALKVGVMPTMDCLPFFIAKEYGLIDSSEVDIRLKHFTAQMDCDTALMKNRVELAVSDIVRVERMKSQGDSLGYYTATNAYWQLIANKRGTVQKLSLLKDRMLAMTRYSATDMLSSMAVDSVRLANDRVFRIQVNDVNVRLQMLRGNQMDAVWLTEPQAAVARLDDHPVLMTGKEKNFNPGVIAIRSEIINDTTRTKQLDALTKAYNAACDSINRMGIKHFAKLITKYYNIEDKVVNNLSDKLIYNRIYPVRQSDVSRAKEWLKDNGDAQ